MKRKMLAAILAACLLLGLASCGEKPEESPSASPSLSAGVTETLPPESTETPSEEERKAQQIETLISGMTIEEKVGQLFLARCPEEDAAQLAGEYALGGYVLFGRDFKDETPESVSRNIASYQASSKVPMLIAVDEEGGDVNRVSRYAAFRSAPFASPRTVYDKDGIAGLEADTAEKAELLLSLGINVNLAPVCDLSDDPSDFIYSRSMGGDPETVGEGASAIVRTMKEQGIGSVLKHFPGYGNNTDTHTGIAYDKRSMETFRTRDFVPFQMAMEAGADAVLVAHNIVYAVDEDLPASLSPKVHEILRDELGFDGVIITDDLAMDAIGQFTDGESAAVLAVEAGNDLLCCTDFQQQLPAVLKAVQEGKISEERIDQSVRRVLRWKQSLGLLEM